MNLSDFPDVPVEALENNGQSSEIVKSLCSHLFLSSSEKDGSAIEKFLTRVLFLRRSNEAAFRENPMEFLDIIKTQGPRQDETCVLCNDCYQLSRHDGHEVYFYHSQAGGCCDCGDPDAWDSNGFCTKHGKVLSDPLNSIPRDIYFIGEILLQTIIQHIIDYAVQFTHKCNIDNFTPNEQDLSNNVEFSLLVQHDDIHSVQDIILAFIALPHLLINTANHELLISNIQTNGYCILMTADLVTIKFNAQILQEKGFHVAILPLKFIENEHKIIKIISWLYKLAQTGDELCRLICNTFSIPRLKTLMEMDSYLNKPLTQALHGLFLTLMADQSFKLSVAIGYAQAFRHFAKVYGSGIGTNETAIFGLSVQFLNRATFVAEMVGSHGFLLSLSDSLSDMLDDVKIASTSTTDSDNNNVENGSGSKNVLSHMVLANRRYNPLLGDLKVVFSTP
eukprot:gene4635-9199_t